MFLQCYFLNVTSIPDIIVTFIPVISVTTVLLLYCYFNIASIIAIIVSIIFLIYCYFHYCNKNVTSIL